MILDDLKILLTANGITDTVVFNFNTLTGNGIILWQYDGTPSDNGKNAKVQISIKNTNMQTAEQRATAIYDIIYPKATYQKGILVNNKLMHIRPIQEPFYNELDDKSRHSYIFNIDINYNR